MVELGKPHEHLSRGAAKHRRRVLAQQRRTIDAHPSPAEVIEEYTASLTHLSLESRKGRRERLGKIKGVVARFEWEMGGTWREYAGAKTEMLWIDWKEGRIDAYTHRRIYMGLFAEIPVASPDSEYYLKNLSTEPGIHFNRLDQIRDAVLEEGDVSKYNQELNRDERYRRAHPQYFPEG